MKISSLPTPLSVLVYAWIATSTANAMITPPSAPSVGQSVAVVRRSPPRLGADALEAWTREKLAAVTAKYGTGSPSQKRAVGTNSLTDQQFDSSYFGSIAVGTPPISYNVILDTGSADLWIATSSNNRSSNSGQNSIPLYNPTASTTFTESSRPFEVTYGSGAVAGVLGTDKVQFAGFEVESQAFGLVNQVTPQLLTTPVSGLMGLAFQSIATSQASPFWQAITSANQLDSPVMSFHLTRMVNSTQARELEFGGTFTFGSVNNTLFSGDIDFQNIPNGAPGYWILDLTGITAEGRTVNVPTGSASWAAIDTGTTGIAGPANVLTQLYAAIPGSQEVPGSQGFWSVPCNTDFNVTMRFGDSNTYWMISADDFRLQQLDDNTCVGAFFALPSSTNGRAPAWIVGDTFLKNVYSVFRSSPPSVGFARLSPTAITLSNPNIPVPSPTLAPTPNSIGGGGSANGALSDLHGPGALLALTVTAVLGVLLALL